MDLLVPVELDLLFQGSQDDPRLGSFVKPLPLSSVHTLTPSDIVILGNPDDLGVTLNGGRKGAKEGPRSIREYLYKMVVPGWVGHLYDLGDIICDATDLWKTRERLIKILEPVSRAGATVITLGGGHDFSFPNFKGTYLGSPRNKWGIINIDPHLDVRPFKNGLPHSGSGFREILDSKLIDPELFVEFGSQRNRASFTHLTYLRQLGSSVIPMDTLWGAKGGACAVFESCLQDLCKNSESVFVSLDMDVCGDTQGVSAPTTVGLSAVELVQIARSCGKQTKIKLFEIAEVAPPLEASRKSSQVAAECVFYFLDSRFALMAP